jgi:hypothetical protein
MDPSVFHALQTRSASIHVRWETLLRIEPVTGPLANPDALARLIPESLAEIFALMKEFHGEPLSLSTKQLARLPNCTCGHNPYLAYFVAAERAFVETLVLIQTEMPPSATRESDVAEVIRAVRSLGGSEIDTFCGICAHRCRDPRCRHLHAAAV